MYRWWRWRWVGETHAGLFQKAPWGFAEAPIKLTLHHHLLWGLNVTRPGFHWHSQMPRGGYANANANTFRYFCLRQISDSTWLSGKGQRRERWQSEGNPQWERMEGGWGKKKCEKWVIHQAWDPHFFWAFSSFGHDTMWYGSPWAGVWLTGMSSLSGVFRPNQRSDLGLAPTEEICFFKASNAAGVHARCRAGEGRKEKKMK